ncbi:MAG: hypothetical protein M0005_06565 [Actinomycetota bacterium]|nr:hypothetical protein [Actinomycetota bacterium]
MSTARTTLTCLRTSPAPCSSTTHMPARSLTLMRPWPLLAIATMAARRSSSFRNDAVTPAVRARTGP